MAILPEIEIIAVFLLIAAAIAVVQTRTQPPAPRLRPHKSHLISGSCPTLSRLPRACAESGGVRNL